MQENNTAASYLGRSLADMMIRSVVFVGCECTRLVVDFPKQQSLLDAHLLHCVSEKERKNANDT